MNRNSGFALRDAIFTLAAVGALGALSLPVLSQVRMDSGRQRCNNNYRFLGQANGVYSADFNGYMAALSWKGGTPNPLAFGSYFASDAAAQSAQAIIIERELLNVNAFELPLLSSWFASIAFSHLPLLAYVGGAPFLSGFVCPEDGPRQLILEGDYSRIPTGGDDSGASNRWILSSSYTAGASHWAPSRQVQGTRPNGLLAWAPMPYVTASNYSQWAQDGDPMVFGTYGPRQESEVAFPSNKVFLSDDYARHNGTQRFFAYQTASQDLLFYDGSVRFYRSDSTNPGWDQSHSGRRSTMTLRTTFIKKADTWGQLDNNAASVNFPGGWHRWTRGGLLGWDVPRAATRVAKPVQNVVENELATNWGHW